jgi:hypothetical protein
MFVRMIRFALGIMFAGMTVAVTTAQADRPLLSGLSPDIRALVLIWLNTDCGVGKSPVLDSRLVALGPRLEAVFWEAYRLGPPSDEMERDRAAIAQRYEQRQRELRESGEKLFGAEEAKRLLAVSQADYIKRELDLALIGYKTAAIVGLGFVGTAASVGDLARIAADDASPARVAAQQATERLRQRGVR